MRFMERYTDVTYALLRIIAGLMFATHGAQKTLGLFGGQKMDAPLMIVGGWIELIGGLLIAFGLFTGIAAFICSGMMAVAYFMAHAPGGFWPVMNKGETAVLYCFVFLYIASRGSGRFSIDSLRSKEPAARMRV
jgi:putative oxidoreductase